MTAGDVVISPAVPVYNKKKGNWAQPKKPVALFFNKNQENPLCQCQGPKPFAVVG